MMNPIIIVVAGTLFGQSQVSVDMFIDDMCQVEESIVLIDIDSDCAIIVDAKSIILSDDFVFSIQNELCSYRQNLNEIIFTDKERFPP